MTVLISSAIHQSAQRIDSHDVATPFDWQNATWQSQLANTIKDSDTLCKLLGLTPSDLPHYTPTKFPLNVPHAFVAKMAYGDKNDPLLRQILPSIDETKPHPDYTTDPLAENTQNPIKGLLHKYQNRVLITLTGACAVHCRYCFRQHFDYHANLPKKDIQHAIVDYLLAHDEIDEVLLSGGDPLNVSNRRLMDWLDVLASTQIRTVRLHTRLPIVLPARIDDELTAFFANYPKHIVMVIHTNHANEIDHATKIACQKLKQAGVTMLNQSVLLKGVNDDVDTLVQLSHALFDAGVLPYYLHILDKVAGASHFDVPKKTAIALYWQLLARLSGYLVPKLVQELPNRPYKTPVDIYGDKS